MERSKAHGTQGKGFRLAFFFVLLLAYPLSYAPFYACGKRSTRLSGTWEELPDGRYQRLAHAPAKSLEITSNGRYREIPGVARWEINQRKYRRVMVYFPVQWLIDETPLREPLLAWAQCWHVREELETPRVSVGMTADMIGGGLEIVPASDVEVTPKDQDAESLFQEK